MLKPLGTLFLLLTCLSVLGQVKIEGTVSHLEDPISRVYIEVYIDGVRKLDEVTNARGHYSVEIPFFTKTELVFKKRKMLPIHVLVNTSPENIDIRTSDLYKVPFNLEMFYTYASLGRNSIFEQPIGELTMKGNGDQTFQLEVNQSVLDAIKTYQKQSQEIEYADVEKPVDYQEVISDEEVSESDNSDTTEELMKASLEDTLEKEAHEELVAQTKASERLASLIEKESKVAALRKEQAIENKSQQESDKSDLLGNDRRIKAEILQDSQQQKLEEQSLIIEQYQKDEQLAKYAGAITPKKDNTATELIKKLVTEKFNYSSTIYLIEKQGVLNKYEMTSYNWLFFDADYYYLNDKEIPQSEYEAAISIFN